MALNNSNNSYKFNNSNTYSPHFVRRGEKFQRSTNMLPEKRIELLEEVERLKYIQTWGRMSASYQPQVFDRKLNLTILLLEKIIKEMIKE